MSGFMLGIRPLAAAWRWLGQRMCAVPVPGHSRVRLQFRPRWSTIMNAISLRTTHAGQRGAEKIAYAKAQLAPLPRTLRGTGWGGGVPPGSSTRRRRCPPPESVVFGNLVAQGRRKVSFSGSWWRGVVEKCRFRGPRRARSSKSIVFEEPVARGRRKVSFSRSRWREVVGKCRFRGTRRARSVKVTSFEVLAAQPVDKSSFSGSLRRTIGKSYVFRRPCTAACG